MNEHKIINLFILQKRDGEFICVEIPRESGIQGDFKVIESLKQLEKK